MRHTIKKGKHDASEWAFGFHRGTRSEVWETEFTNSNLYAPLDSENDWNKLCGWSYWHHHKNSIRAGWRAAGEQQAGHVELCLYLYENGQRVTSYKTILVPVNRKVTVLLDYEDGEVTMFVKILAVATQTIKMPYSAKPSWGYFLFPFFGGNAPAPHEMFINLKRV